MIHQEPHPLAGTTVIVDGGIGIGPVEYRLEDWWDRIYGTSWMNADGNPAALHYAFRAGIEALPIDNNVVYGKVGSAGYLAHISEIRSADERGVA